MAYTVETRGAADDVLHDLVQAGLPRLLATLAAEDRYLPPFVVQELEDYLRCGDVACGFGWLACDDCPHHRLVAFSCKGRGFCPSCMSRRMEERSERWVTALFPFRRVRQWVLTVPWPRRWLFARHHQLARGVLRVAMAVIQAFYADRTAGGRTGTVTVVQRWGSALPLNIHFHILAVDGTFERQDDDTVLWRASPPPTTDEIERLVEDIARRAEAWLAKKGFGPNDEDFEENETDALLHAAAVAGHSAFQRRRSQQIAGREIRLPPLCAAYQGYTVHAGVSIPAHDRAGLRRLCRYILRPPIARDRLERRTDGRVALNLKRPQANGATEVVFTPEELVERLAAGIPRSRRVDRGCGGW
jgi:hypothetical protein